MDDKTKIPLIWVLSGVASLGAALVVLLAAATWVGRLENRVSANELASGEAVQYMRETNQSLRSMDERLSWMEGHMGKKK